MKNLIYVAIFHNKKYIELLYILLKSLKIFGKIDRSIDILILTHDTFKEDIEFICDDLQIHKYIIYLNATSILDSKLARLKIFDLDFKVENYSQILYLDIDVIVQKDIREIFKYNLDNKLYAKDEGNTHGEFYGAIHFKEHGFTEKKPTFCSGVLLFKPCEEIRELFTKTLNHIEKFQKSGRKFGTCIDQPFLNFNAIIQNLHDITLLSNIVTNNPDINTKKETICHFAGNTCSYDVKIKRMDKFYTQLK